MSVTVVRDELHCQQGVRLGPLKLRKPRRQKGSPYQKLIQMLRSHGSTNRLQRQRVPTSESMSWCSQPECQASLTSGVPNTDCVDMIENWELIKARKEQLGR